MFRSIRQNRSKSIYTEWVAGNGRFLNECYGAGRGERGLGGGQLNSSGHTISVVVKPQWTWEYRVFAYDSFVKSVESIIEIQRLFRCRFNIGGSWEHSKSQYHLEVGHIFWTRGTIMKEKPPGPAATARTPENVERVREATRRSPTRSARRHAVELGMSKTTVRWILHKMACNSISFRDNK